MWKFALAGLALAALMGSAPSAAGSATESHPKPSSFVPHAPTSNHVYGTPIQAPIVGHRKTSHQKHAPKQRASGAAHSKAR
jgi:hypothetical protein